MFECSDNPIQMCQFPTELIIYMLKFLCAKNLIACRQVCKRWKEIVDDVSTDDSMWEEHCKRDYGALYKDAKRNTKSCHLWYDIYRSLTLWGRLSVAKETLDEFCNSEATSDEILYMCLLKNGELLVHKRASVFYYDISTLELSGRRSVACEFIKFIECDEAILILTYQSHVIIKKKLQPVPDSDTGMKEEARFRHIKQFLPFGNKIYLVHFTNTIMLVDLDEGLIAKDMPRTYDENVATLSVINGTLHVVTAERNIYKLENNEFVKLFDLESVKSNLFDCLWRYQFLEKIDWRFIQIWMTKLRITIPEGPLRYISMIKVYGDIFFVGCKNGLLLIYYKPYVDGQLDLFKHKPVKQFNFGTCDIFPELSLEPILKIEIEELIGGHRIFVAMQKKIIIIKYMNDFGVAKSQPVTPSAPAIPIQVD